MERSVMVGVEFAGVEVQTPAKVIYHTQKEIVTKAGKAWGMCWITAILTVFIPVIHLVVTPIALVAGPLVAIFVYFKVKDLPRSLSGEARCAHCQLQTPFAFEKVTPPFFEMCQHCKTGYQVNWPPLNKP